MRFLTTVFLLRGVVLGAIVKSGRGEGEGGGGGSVSTRVEGGEARSTVISSQGNQHYEESYIESISGQGNVC